ncbi:MAG: glucose-1-phosphate adenylyltransferase subunit GlgD [Atopobiaceae bacterium]|nr:glucose-1-phosphate adenylyltransferase subunit GlgD [Atopobiaceae bacterium]
MKAKTLGIITCNYAARSQSILTAVRPVSNLPFLGRYRLVDFPLSNFVNAGLSTVGVIMPREYRSIIDHVGSGKEWGLDRKGGGLFYMPGSAFGSTRSGSRFLLGDLLANRVILDRSDAELVLVSSSSFVYNMDMNELLDAHLANGADITMLTKRATQSYQDVVRLDVENGRVLGTHLGIAYGETAFLDAFVIRLERLKEIIGWYESISHLDLFEALREDFPRMNIRTHEFKGYVAPIFDVPSYYQHSMEMLDTRIIDELFPAERYIQTKAHDTAPARYQKGCSVRNSLVSAGCDIKGSVSGSILGRGVVVEAGAIVANSILMQDCIVGSGARIENAIVDRNNTSPAGTELRGTPEQIFVKGKGGV